MPNLNMYGSYDLTTEAINSNVGAECIGNYALGFIKDDSFIVHYVGRSDTDLAVRLKQHILEKYEKFKFSYATTVKEAFEKECKNYHDFNTKGTLDNKEHPKRPEGKNWQCPCCENFE